ncbi:hypothetical protein [Minwuia thermotolerans]|uniref:Uncharacterized protein n=1 Tax=Minwuia thermotolerans TaxID=2056226 RepID=A0A2M9G6S4_9PROT|nr:hypothetical protein [Minwuia thermotolerans]PJK31419.1 hypothetical protein CVT23_01720 [Minwuia thermotolerans]
MISDRAAGRLIAIATILVGAMVAMATEPLPAATQHETNSGLTEIAPTEALQPDLASLVP